MNKSAFSMFFAAAMIAPLATFAADGQATAGQSAAPPTTGESSTTVTTSDLDRVECKKLAPPTGTRLGGRTVCQTVRQWQVLMHDSQETLTRMQNRGAAAGPVPGN